MDFSSINHANLHHAYLLEGDHERIIPALIQYLGEQKIAAVTSVGVRSIPVFYIEDARSLRESQIMVADGRRVIVVAFDRMIDAAQHALLKTIEEPTAGSHFFFVGRSRDLLLPTVLSRMMILRPEERSDTAVIDDRAREYNAADLFGRTELLKAVIARARGDDDESDDERASARRELIQFLDSIERVLADRLRKGDKEVAEAVTMIIAAKRDLADASPSIKMIFEHLGLRLPRIKR
jgi:DNA polymerase III delta prime subunit